MNFQSTVIPNAEDYLTSSASFSGTKRTILSKDFKGGRVNNAFGSTELDFTAADMTGTAVLDINLAFGEITIVVPCDWRVDADMSQFLAVVEDYRPAKYQYQSTDKILILKGSSCCGSIEVHHNC
ncbi:MAG TPA: LiaF domain-containing protein [Mucilaginibacter sp.]|nr:LiaF domain-containing protein [Mucilaginibacter sp.]